MASLWRVGRCFYRQLLHSQSLRESIKIPQNKLSSLSSDSHEHLVKRDRHIDALEAHVVELQNKGMPTQNVLQRLLVLHYERKNFKRVKELKAELDQKEFVYTGTMLVQLLNVSIIEEDLETSQQLFRRLDGISGFTPIDQMVLKYVALLIAKDHANEALKILKQWQPTHGEHHDELQIHVRGVLYACAKKGDAELTENVLQLMINKRCCKITSVFLGPAIVVYLETDLNKAVSRFEEFVKLYSCTPSKNLLLEKLIDIDDTKNIQKIVDLSSEIHGKLNTLHDLAFIYIECGKADDARKLFMRHGMRGRQDRLEHCCEDFLKRGQLRMLEDVISVTSGLCNIDKDRLYLYLIRGHSQAKDPKKALGVLTLMQEKGTTPSATTLTFLAKVLKEFNEPIPFVVPEKREGSLPATYVRVDKQFQFGKLQIGGMTPESASQLSQLSVRIRSLVKEGDMDMALEMIHSLLDKQQYPSHHVFKFTLNKLAKQGDVDRLKALEPKLNTSIKTIVFFNSVMMKAHVCKGTHEEILREFEMNVSEMEFCPEGGFIALLKEHPELLERVENLARNYAKYDYFGLLNVIWNHHFMNENYEAADKIFKETSRFLVELGFDRILHKARVQKNVPMLEKLLKVIKTTNLPMHCIGSIYERMITLHYALGDTEGALETLQNAKKDGVRYLIRRSIMGNLNFK